MKKEVCYLMGMRVKTTVSHGKLYTSTTTFTMRLLKVMLTVQMLMRGTRIPMLNTATKEQTPSQAMQNTQRVELDSAYAIFWIILTSQFMISVATKMKTSKQFRAASIMNKLQHSLNILHIPDVFQEWDEGCDELKENLERWGELKIEMLVASLVHLIMNIALISPAFLTGKISNLITTCSNIFVRSADY